MFLFKDIKRKERNMLHQTSMHTHIPQTTTTLKPKPQGCLRTLLNKISEFIVKNILEFLL